jgi:predicted metal-dependent hydrolase
MAGSASEMAQGAYDQGRRYTREAAERYPQAERYYQEGRRVVREYTPENPMLSLLLGAAIGYGMAWIIHHKGWRDERHVLDYARTKQGFKPY